VTKGTEREAKPVVSSGSKNVNCMHIPLLSKTWCCSKHNVHFTSSCYLFILSVLSHFVTFRYSYSYFSSLLVLSFISFMCISLTFYQSYPSHALHFAFLSVMTRLVTPRNENKQITSAGRSSSQPQDFTSRSVRLRCALANALNSTREVAFMFWIK
jgi:hypothetical protein